MRERRFEDYPELMSVEEAAQLLRMSPKIIQHRCRSGELPCGRLPDGKRWYISNSQLHEQMFSHLYDDADQHTQPDV